MLGFFTRSARDFGNVVRLRLADRTPFLVNHTNNTQARLDALYARDIGARW